MARGLASTVGGRLNVRFGAVISPGAKRIGVSSKLEHWSDFMAGLISRALGDTALAESLCSNDLIQWMNMDGCYLRITCKVKNNHLQELCCLLVSEKEFLFVRIEVGFASSNASFAPKPMEVIIREMKHDFKMLQDQVNAIDNEGGRRLDNVGKDLAYLRKKIKRKVKRSKNAVIGLIAELEIKVDKLALNLDKQEVPPNPGFSSSSEGKFN